MRSWQGDGIKRLNAAEFRDAFRPGHPEGRVESFTRRDGLSSDAVSFIFQDRRDGSIWVGTDHGLDHFREPAFLPSLPRPGGASLSAFRRKSDYRVWIGSLSGGGLWVASPEGKTERIPLSGISIQSLYETRGGRLWFETASPSSVASIASIPDVPNDGKTTSLPLTPELQSQVAVQSIVEDRGGAVWASFIPYGFSQGWEGGRWIKNGGLTGLPDAWVVILNTVPTVNCGPAT